METPAASKAQPKSGNSLLHRAKRGDKEAISLMFRQFTSADEQIVAVEYLGTRGVFGIGTHSFGCVTDKRVADIELGLFGRLNYQDAYLEHVNSSAFYQPSLAGLYGWIFAVLAGGILAAFWTGFGVVSTILIALVALLLILFVARVYYHFVKSGVLFWVREGIPVYLFANRKRLPQAAAVWRLCTQARDDRISGRMRTPADLASMAGNASAGQVLGRRSYTDLVVAAGIVGVLLAGTVFVGSSLFAGGAGSEFDFSSPQDTLMQEGFYADTMMLEGAELHSARGNELINNYDWVGAEVEFRRAVELEPTNAMYQNQLGIVLNLLGRTEEGMAALREAVRLEPENEQYRIDLEDWGA